MTIQTAPVPPESVETIDQSSRRVGILVLILLLIGAAAAVVVGYRASHPDHPPTYSSEQLQSMAALTLPSQFDRVDAAWACVSNEQSACFTSSLTGLDAVESLTSDLGAKEYTTMAGSGGAPAQYAFCTSVGTAPAAVVIAARPTNAVNQGGAWIVPAGQEPRLDGSTVNVHLTGPGTCP